MDLDKAFVAALLRSGVPGLQKSLEIGVTSDLLSDDGKRAYDFAYDYFRQYSALPTSDIVEGACGITLEDPQAPMEFFAEQVVNRKLHSTMRHGVRDVAELLEKNDTRAAFDALQSHAFKLRSTSQNFARTVPISSLGQTALDWYRRIKLGERGILTPWESLNEATFGFWPEDLILIVARLGVGKTWGMLKMAHYVRKEQGKKVLFVTTEMAQEQIALRWTSLEALVPYYELRHGTLADQVEDRMKDALEAAKADQDLKIVGGDFDFKIETLDAIVAESDADAVFVDGAYLLRCEGVNRTERAANTYDELKRMAKRRKKPIIASTQFNREVKSGSKASTMKTEKIAMSDVAGWNADQIYAMYQTEEMRADRRMGWHPMKIREGFAEDWETMWDLEKMEFSEIGAASKSKTSDADEFGTGLPSQAPSGNSNVPF